MGLSVFCVRISRSRLDLLCCRKAGSTLCTASQQPCSSPRQFASKLLSKLLEFPLWKFVLLHKTAILNPPAQRQAHPKLCSQLPFSIQLYALQKNSAVLLCTALLISQLLPFKGNYFLFLETTIAEAATIAGTTARATPVAWFLSVVVLPVLPLAPALSPPLLVTSVLTVAVTI